MRIPRYRTGFWVLLAAACMTGNARAQPGQTSQERRQQYLRELQQIMEPQHFRENTRRASLQDSTWMDWLHRTGELPPDFSRMPSSPFLPELLRLDSGGTARPVRTRADWERKKDWIREQYRYWIAGEAPPPPEDIRATILNEREENGVLIQMIRLNFGPGHRAKMTLELMIPRQTSGEGKKTAALPVYMTQWTHRGWAQLAVRRGYIGCVYAAADSKDDTQAYQALYPDYDFCMLMRRAWGASRVLDYLLTRKEVNPSQIAITGHSRNGKQSLWAAAFDERFSAVISSSSGTGGSDPWRYSDPQYDSETLDRVVAYNAHWFHPRLRFFYGKEDRLPVDQHSLLSLIAPRALLFHHSLVENGYNPWANEQCYLAVKKVYDFLGAGARIGIFTRMGQHAVAARDVERCIDFLDIQFGRKRLPWENKLYFEYDFEKWAAGREAERAAVRKMSPVRLRDQLLSPSGSRHPDTAVLRSQKQKILKNLTGLLGEEPPGVEPAEIAPAVSSRKDWIDMITGRPFVKGAEIVQLGPYEAMGDYLHGLLYKPASAAGRKIPVIIYLHEYSYGHGFSKGHHIAGGKGNSRLFQALVDQGFAVLAIDLFGFGARMEEALYFYERYPQWSKMGKMITDVRACVDAVASFDDLDTGHVFLLGNTLGGGLALLSAALDERVAGVAAVAAFSPWRTSSRQYESLRTWSHLHGLMPRLGYFADDPANLPVDFPEIISCIAPRPLLVIAPRLDRYADAEAVATAMEQVGNVYRAYRAEDDLAFETPPEINRITDEMYPVITRFFKKQLADR